ncbi:hypothetical protein WJX73_008825 [Symbiochloris irregularis]|uniref:FAD-binding domain-containing protein n=1 Tax=Symbiochloris irregularis TaxID=706552 RepID=A0AAW1NV35_9CHLO
MTSVDVAVIGGGPAGLLVALGLIKTNPSLRIKVFERAQRYRECGAGISLHVNGLKSIKAICPELYKQFEARTFEFETFDECNQAGEVVTERSSLPAANMQSEQRLQEYGVKPGFMGWSDIQKLFYQALPQDVVQFGHALADIREHAHGVTLSFPGQPGVEASHVIAADGYFSPTREIIMQDGPPAFQNILLWRARMPWQEGLGFPREGRWARSFIGAKTYSNIYTLQNGTVGWVLSVPTAVYEQRGVQFDALAFATSKQRREAASGQDILKSSTEEQHQRALQAAEGLAPQLLTWIKASDPDGVIEHGLFTRPSSLLEPAADKGWGKGRVTFIGDAAHATRPTGLGLNMALEDCPELAWFIQEQGLSADTFRAFEKDRAPRVAQIVRQEEGRGSLAYKDDVKEVSNRNELLPMKPDEFERFKETERAIKI